MEKARWTHLKQEFSYLRPSRWVWAIFGMDCAVIAISWRLYAHGGWLSLLGWVLLTLGLLHFYLLLHEATHSALSESRRANQWIGIFLGWCIGVPYLTRQRSHLLHHIWTGHPIGDPANERLIQRFSVMTSKQAERLEGVWRKWIPLIAFNDRVGMWLDPFRLYFRGSLSGRIRDEMRMSLASGVAYVGVILLLWQQQILRPFLGWYVSGILTLFVLEELLNLPHHAETPLLQKSDKALPYWEQDRVTHSCRTLPIWSHFVLLNFNLHTAHHLFPWVPWFGLPEIHQKLLSEIPELAAAQQTRNELMWSLHNRRRPLLEIMGHYFDHVPKA